MSMNGKGEPNLTSCLEFNYCSPNSDCDFDSGKLEVIMPVKVMRIEDAPVRIMRWDRGKALRLVDEADGAKNVDVHINLINVDSGPGPTHYHAKAENIYVVLEGEVEAIVEGKKIRLGPGEVAFIPPGVRHQAGNCGDKVARVLEIYAPAGEDFHIVDDSENKPQS